jgi:hypothetical protein
MHCWSHIRRRPIVLTAAALLMLAIVLHVPLLRLGAGVLIADDPLAAPSVVLLAGGDRCLDVARELYGAHASVRSVLVWQSLPGRLELLGVRPLAEETVRDELIARGVAPESIELLELTPDARLEQIERLDGWLTEHPEHRVLILCDRFSSRLWRLRLDRGLSRANRGRVGLRALPDRRYDETNWWRSREGIKAWFGSVFEQLYFRIGRAEPEEMIDYDPDLYEQRVFGK